MRTRIGVSPLRRSSGIIVLATALVMATAAHAFDDAENTPTSEASGPGRPLQGSPASLPSTPASPRAGPNRPPLTPEYPGDFRGANLAGQGGGRLLAHGRLALRRVGPAGDDERLSAGGNRRPAGRTPPPHIDQTARHASFAARRISTTAPPDWPGAIEPAYRGGCRSAGGPTRTERRQLPHHSKSRRPALGFKGPRVFRSGRHSAARRQLADRWSRRLYTRQGPTPTSCTTDLVDF